jgi:hypothetical protein
MEEIAAIMDHPVEYDSDGVREEDMRKRNPKLPLRKGKPRRRHLRKPFVPAFAEPDHVSRGEDACSRLIDPQADQAREPGQVDAEVHPGIEYDIVLTAPPNETALSQKLGSL